MTEDLPIGLIFKPEITSDVDRFYPFDTGALLSDNYKGILDVNNKEEVKVYEVPISNGNEIKKFIKRYYINNERYCFGALNESASPSTPKEENLLRLFKFSSKTSTDLRSRAIEIHSLKDINLSNRLSAIILPMLRSKKYKYLVDKIKFKHPDVTIEYYNDLTRFNSQSIRDAVMTKTMDMYNASNSMKFSYDNL